MREEEIVKEWERELRDWMTERHQWEGRVERRERRRNLRAWREEFIQQVLPELVIP